MTENTALWDKLGKTDPAHTKSFKRAGGFSGTAIKPMWSYRRMTEEFGPCGKGWGIGEPSFQVVNGENREVLVYCTASIWYRDGEQIAHVYGVGGDKIVTHIKANEQYNRPERWESDDEAFKKAFTDGITNALKMIGVGADVHMGMYDDSKYLNTIKQEFAEEKQVMKPANDKQAVSKPASSAAQKRGLADIDVDLLDCKTIDDVRRCAAIWKSISETDGWSRDFKLEAKDKFDAKREEIQKALDASDDDRFPGDTNIINTAGRALHTMEA